MSIIIGFLGRILALFMSLTTFISGVFGGIFAPLKDYTALEDTFITITDGEYMIIDSYDDFIEVIGEVKNETKEYDEEYFETKSLLVFNAFLPQTNYCVVCDSITEVGNTVTVRYHLENDGGIGLTVISSQTVLVEISKGIENAVIFSTTPMPGQ